MEFFDIALLCILLLFAIRGLVQGFVAEAAGIAAILGGIWAAYTFSPQLALQLTFIDNPIVRQASAYVIIFLVVFLIVGFLARIVRRIFSFAFISWLDKPLGCALGFFKGVIICALVLICIKIMVGKTDFMEKSVLLPHLKSLISFL